MSLWRCNGLRWTLKPAGCLIRLKGSDDSVQPLSGLEIRALRKVRREQPAGLRHVFVSERGAPFAANGFFKTLSPRYSSALAAPRLRSSWTMMGSIRGPWPPIWGTPRSPNTARYTKMDAKRFDGFWQD